MLRIATLAAVAALSSTAAAQDTVSFQQGVNGYTGTHDTFVINNIFSDDPRGALDNVNVDGINPEQHGLLRFNDIFGPGPGQVPVGEIVTRATLVIDIINLTGTDDNGFMHRMLADWDQNTLTWDNALLSGNTEAGIQADGVEAAMSPSANFDPGFIGEIVLDVTADVQAWATGDANFGWAFFNGVDDSYGFSSSEDPELINRPVLTVSYAPTPGAASLALIGGLAASRRKR